MTNTSRIKIVIADDHPIVRDGIRAIIRKQEDIEICGEAANGQELIEALKVNTPDVVLTDIKMPVLDGIEACRKIKAQFPDVGVVGLSMMDEQSIVLDMLDAGAKGYLLKNSSKEEIVQAIKVVSYGGIFFSESTAKCVIGLIAMSQHNPYRKIKTIQFTTQEIRVIRLICQQLTTKEIAHRLDLSPRTVEEHRYHIQDKIDAKNGVGIALYAVRHHLINLDEFI